MGNKSSLTFTFKGDYEVDALALVTAIDSLTKISRIIAEKEFPDVHFNLNIKAVKPGSLQFDFVAVAQAAQTLFTPDSISYAANLITILSATFAIKKSLKGGKPKSVEKIDDKIIIENKEGQRFEFPAGANIYFLDSRVDNSTTYMFQCAKDCSGVSGVKVSTDCGETVEIAREEFEDCSREIKFDSMKEDRIVSVRENEILFIRQVDFAGDLKWRFTGDKNISASMLDLSFKSKVQSGSINLNAKTYIVADVQVTVPLNPSGTPDIEKTVYEILAVKEIHTPGEGQLKFEV